jgi:hypothetical protein
LDFFYAGLSGGINESSGLSGEIPNLLNWKELSKIKKKFCPKKLVRPGKSSEMVKMSISRVWVVVDKN